MRASIERSRLSGSARAPASKSYSIRALMCAAMAEGWTEIVGPLRADDTEATLAVLRRLGAPVRELQDRWWVFGNCLQEPREHLPCRESAATLRFATALAAVVPGTSRLVARPGLARRPIEPLLQALQQVGVSCWWDAASSSVIVHGGSLWGGKVIMRGDVSSQFVSALLLVGPLTEEGLQLELSSAVESKPFVLMTVETLKRFGIHVKHSPDLTEFHVTPQRYRAVSFNVEGDWSTASHLLCLGALCGRLKVENLSRTSLQGDKVMFDTLQQMGANMASNEDSVSISVSSLRAVHTDLSDCIDLLPGVAVLAAVAEGVSEFSGIGRARLKESNRVHAVRKGLHSMGIDAWEERDTLKIAGSVPQPAVIDSHGDHRIAMAFAALGLRAGHTVVQSAECVSKTFPGFWELVKNLGGKVALHDQ